jgi:hypothetical protein
LEQLLQPASGFHAGRDEPTFRWSAWARRKLEHAGVANSIKYTYLKRLIIGFGSSGEECRRWLTVAEK